MSGFSSSWLSLREPVDHRARNTKVAGACSAYFSRLAEIRVLDLGCGTGSNLRALAPQLSQRQFWRLVDHDKDLLAVAREALCEWADEVSQGSADVSPDLNSDLDLVHNGKLITVTFVCADLQVDFSNLLQTHVDLVSCAALFDLCSSEWITQCVTLLVEKQRPLMACLTYDGRETWRPPHPLDGAMLRAFHQHQQGNKGLGIAAGPGAAQALRTALKAQGYLFTEGDSVWHIGAGDADLVQALAEGSSEAVLETGLVPRIDIDAWRLARQSGCSADIGHIDIFSHPPN